MLTGVTASRSTTWVTKFVVTATRATTWNVAAASAGTSISENFNTGTVAADANFTNVLGTVVISGGKLVSASPSSDVSARHNTHLSSVDHYAEATLTFGDPFGTYSGPCVRYSPSAQTYYAFRILNGGAAYFSRYEGGSETNLGSQSYTFVSGQTYVLRSEVQGTALRGYVNGALVYSTTDPYVCRPAIRSASTSTCTATRPAVRWICSQPVYLLLWATDVLRQLQPCQRSARTELGDTSRCARSSHLGQPRHRLGHW